MKKKGAKPFEYPDKPFSPYDEAKKRVTKENLESSFRDMMSNNTNWLKERNKKK